MGKHSLLQEYILNQPHKTWDDKGCHVSVTIDGRHIDLTLSEQGIVTANIKRVEWVIRNLKDLFDVAKETSDLPDKLVPIIPHNPLTKKLLSLLDNRHKYPQETFNELRAIYNPELPELMRRLISSAIVECENELSIIKRSIEYVKLEHKIPDYAIGKAWVDRILGVYLVASKTTELGNYKTGKWLLSTENWEACLASISKKTKVSEDRLFDLVSPDLIDSRGSYYVGELTVVWGLDPTETSLSWVPTQSIEVTIDNIFQYWDKLEYPELEYIRLLSEKDYKLYLTI